MELCNKRSYRFLANLYQTANSVKTDDRYFLPDKKLIYSGSWRVSTKSYIECLKYIHKRPDSQLENGSVLPRNYKL